MERTLSGKRRQILEFIARHTREQGYPPSVREIGEAVGLNSSSTVHTHLQVLQRDGYLQRDPTKPRAIVVNFEPASGAARRARPVAHVPLVGNVAAGVGVLAEENVEDVYPLPGDLTGDGELFMLRVRGDSMLEAGILPDDLVVVRRQPVADDGDMVVAALGEDEATVKYFRRRPGDHVALVPANAAYDETVLPASDVAVYGKVVTVLRRL
jgi:repressor LexA